MNIYGISGTEEKKARCVDDDDDDDEDLGEEIEVVGSGAGVGAGSGPSHGALAGREPGQGLGGAVNRGGSSMYRCLGGGVSDEEDEKVIRSMAILYHTHSTHSPTPRYTTSHHAATHHTISHNTTPRRTTTHHATLTLSSPHLLPPHTPFLTSITISSRWTGAMDLTH